MTTQLIRRPEGGYTTPDGRYLITHGCATSCAPSRWWTVADTTNTFVVYAPTLKRAGELIAWIEAEDAKLLGVVR